MKKRVALIDRFILVALVVIVGAHLPSAYRNYKVRHWVADGLALATPGTRLVEKNARAGRILDSGWEQIGGEVVVAVDAGTGVITVTYVSSTIDGGGKTLTLTPVLGAGVDGKVFSADALASDVRSVTAVSWICASSMTITRSPHALAHKGTLHSRFAPLSCRW